MNEMVHSLPHRRYIMKVKELIEILKTADKDATLVIKTPNCFDYIEPFETFDKISKYDIETDSKTCTIYAICKD